MLQQYQLKNKLKVLLMESHKAPVVAVQMWVKTGSADEKRGQEGISHFIEHLVFKGTKKYGVGEIAKTIEGSGGELNAYTTFDHTVFHVTMSRDFLDVGLDCISEMMGFPKFDPEEIDREREVVIEEIKRSFDNPHQVASQQLFSTAFKKHPYGIPIIGYDSNIRSVTPKTLLKYYESRYVPSNMTLVVAGDFEKPKIKNQIEKYYGPFEKHPLKKIARSKEAPQNKMRLAYRSTEFQEASLSLAFRVPHAKHNDVPGLDVIGFILGQGDSSRLVSRLRLEQSLVTDISAGSFNPLDPGIFIIGANLKAQNFEAVMDAIGAEVKLLLENAPDPEELQRARLNLESEEIYSLETVDGLARKVGTFQTLLNDPTYIEKYLKQVQKLKPEDILRIARKYFVPKTLVSSLMVHKNDQALITESVFETAVKKFTATIQEALKKKPGRQKFKRVVGPTLKVPLNISSLPSQIVKHRLSNGTLVIFKRNAEIPTVSTKVGFLGGVRLENDKHGGATSLLSNTWTSGSAKYSEREIASLIEGNAGGISAFGGRNSIGLNLESLSINLEENSEIFEDVLTKPSFPQEAVERETQILKQYLKTRSDHPSSVAAQIFMENIFKGHPYAKDMLGTEKSLNEMKRDFVHEHWKKTVCSDNAVVVCVGDFNPDKQMKFLERVTKSLGRGQKHDEIFSTAPLSQDLRFFSKSEKEQTHIIVGYRGISFKDPDRFALQVLQAILAGQGGRLFIELRDKASLAYTVSPIHLDGMETGYFGVYIGCSPEKGEKSIEMIKAEIEKIVSKPPSDLEIERAKRYLIGRNHIDLQRSGAQASSILFDELYGLDCQETFNYSNHINKLTKDNIHAVAKRIFKAPSVMVAVGSTQPW